MWLIYTFITAKNLSNSARFKITGKNTLCYIFFLQIFNFSCVTKTQLPHQATMVFNQSKWISETK